MSYIFQKIFTGKYQECLKLLTSSESLKVHIILHHYQYQDYFDMTQKSVRFTNGEFVESTHHSIKLG